MIRVLVVEDEPVSAAAHAEYVGRVPGFVVAGHAATGLAALRRLAADPVDLVLLDIYLPDITGLEVLRRLRAAGNTTDVITMTRARDLAVVQAAVSYGATHYLVKPFTFATVRRKLEQYRAYRAELLGHQQMIAQADIDHLLGALREAGPAPLPKGLSRESLSAVAAALGTTGPDSGLSATEMATMLGASRATARRYLEYLAEAGLAIRHTRYGRAGRPEVEYRHRRPGDRVHAP
ncbi:response regulator [Pseudonocardia sp. H11422]|uniref:response regulator n=1 Tax=Pseudonocardia sp. H11422 TaxID=2835866 RepID=UPI001BDD8D0B|nr:response regulator [Pseudonocardia sp. H11422]